MAQAAQPGYWDNQERAQKQDRDRARIEAVVSEFKGQEKLIEDAGILLELGLEGDDESVEAEIEELIAKADRGLAAMELRRMMSGEHDSMDAILEIHSGAGGTDAQDWAQMLLRMYVRWAERHGFKIEEADYQSGEEAGLKSATLMVRGDYAYGWMRAEAGVHRLVRISPFDSNARRQTAFAAVRVTPELDDSIDADIDWEKDVREDRYRSSGAGGQHVNKTESAIRLTHLPTGIVVACQSERSQHKNRATAKKILTSRLYDYLKAQQDAEVAAKAASTQLKIEWGSQIRSYVNHPYRLVKDHRTSHEVSNFDAVLDGELDGFMEAYLLKAGSPSEPEAEEQLA
jgi:peptide chain release factor 2